LKGVLDDGGGATAAGGVLAIAAGAGATVGAPDIEAEFAEPTAAP
jgi:phage-related minor tail protein